MVDGGERRRSSGVTLFKTRKCEIVPCLRQRTLHILSGRKPLYSNIWKYTSLLPECVCVCVVWEGRGGGRGGGGGGGAK